MAPEHVVVAPLLVALVTAIATLLLRAAPRVQRGLSVLGGVAYAVAVAAVFRAVAREGHLVYALADWDAPVGIVLVADSLSAFMLVIAAVVGLAAVVFSVGYLDPANQTLSYHSLFHFMLAGVTGAFLTGDLFNLFVWFEVMLMSSYVLVVFYSGPEHTRAALHYAVLNLVGSAVMLLAIGGIYAVTGTLNMADIAARLGSGAADPAPVLGLSAVLFAVFALKAGIVPFQFWVPAAYRAAPAPVTAVLAGVVKKVGIYAVVRLYFTVFAAATLPVSLPFVAGDSFLAFFGPVMFAMAVGSILLGGIGAVNQPDVDGLLAYSSIGQVGFIVLPLAVAATAPFGGEVMVLGIAAALVYSLNHGLAKGLLFLAAGATRRATGATRFADLGGISERDPVFAGAFFLGALALVGIPPLSGFFGKFLVFDVGVRAGATGALAVALVGAILTIAYFSRAWNRAFWGEPVAYERKPLLVGVVCVLAVALVVAGLAFDPVFRAAEAAAEAAVNRSGYVDAVLEVGT
ncbi:complex I subunit 5 family protein [Halosegnis marinus]|uniref:Complex I subunit 5 family protein n=1 Tax=Halosegnis marinus TaxID=3034023 RepID=A0ABD5ZRG5_9EURY|nr:proton-conducting transporter membrane subunit [Halosegnis sp. DT85]